MIGFISFFLIFSLLVFVHEFGHFFAAKLTGVSVQEFGFGYPPRLVKLGVWRGTTLSLNALPFGGFVRMSEDDISVEGSLAGKGRATRAFVYTAGALMNVVLAVVLYSATFMLGALTPIEAPGAGIYYIAPRSPAEQVGLRVGDTIVTIDGDSVRKVQTAIDLIRAGTGRPLEIVVRRDGNLMPPVLATPRVDPPPDEGALGVALDLPLEKRSYPLWEAVPLGARATLGMVGAIVDWIRSAILGRVPLQISGPVGIYHQTVEIAKTGLERLTEFAAFLSLNLFLMNLLPLPALDGGRLLFILLEWVRGGRRVPPEKEGRVHAVGMLLLIALMFVMIFVDYLRYYA